ncbi:tyrosine-type recombinase/integrase [Nocardia sp. NPDC050630]|uniref:tyrosine-type recombinase/integrase n=1 Tax=Nocardia sp. NPDC050630 TaxID=3364321 RepID=UPI003791BCE7
MVIFAACTASRIGEVSGCRVGDIDTDTWTWEVRRQTTPSPGGLEDKGTKGNRARYVPLIEEVRQLVTRRLAIVGRDNPDARLFRGPRGGRIATGVLRDATHWDEVVTKLGYEHLRRHDLRHTGLTWMAEAGVSLHVLQKIAGHADSRTTERYLHPDRRDLDTDASTTRPISALRVSGRTVLRSDAPRSSRPGSACQNSTRRTVSAPATFQRIAVLVIDRADSHESSS